MRARQRVLMIAIGIVLMIGALNAPPAAHALQSAAVTVNVLIPTGAWRPLQWTTVPPTVHDTQLISANGYPLTIRIYRPARAARAGLVIYTPLIGGKLDDPRLVNLAETFARAGFMVATPMPEKESIAASAGDVADVISAAELLLQEVSAVGLFGISYGNGPAFAASADERLKSKVAFLVSLNGMYDLRNVVEFIETGAFSYQDIAGTLAPHSYAKEILASTREAEDIPSERNHIENESFARLRATLSPASYVENITFPVFLIHATTDQFIPYTETMRLHDALAPRVPTSFLLTEVIEHGTYRKLTLRNIQQLYLPALSGFYRSINSMLRYAA